MKVTALGEFGLIAKMSRIAGRASRQLVVGIGDDAAAWEPSPTLELATTDMLVEGIHFTLDTASWFELGWKAVAVNLSDIAAMGGQPRFLLISLALPESTEVEAVEEFYRGAVDIADRFSAVIAGGDTVRSPGQVVVGVTALGSATNRDGTPCLLRRDAAKLGDLVAVTGACGASAAGLEMLRGGEAVSTEAKLILRAAHLKPTPRVAEAQVLLAAGVDAAMDVSDGLVGDLAKICSSSGVAAVIESAKVPVSPAATSVYGQLALAMALYGGEDYELLFCASPQVVARAAAALDAAGLTAISVIGKIVKGPAGRVLLRDQRGIEVEPSAAGYDAFGA